MQVHLIICPYFGSKENDWDEKGWVKRYFVSCNELWNEWKALKSVNFFVLRRKSFCIMAWHLITSIACRWGIVKWWNCRLCEDSGDKVCGVSLISSFEFNGRFIERLISLGKSGTAWCDMGPRKWKYENKIGYKYDHLVKTDVRVG